LPHWEALQQTPGAEQVLLPLARAIGSARLRLIQPAAEFWLARIRIAETVGDQPTLGDSLISLALDQLRHSRAFAIILLRAAVEIGRAEQRPRLVARALGNLSTVTMPFDIADSAAYLREAQDAAQKSGEVYLLAISLVNRTVTSILQGSWQEATDLLASTPAVGDVRFILPVLDAVISEARGTTRTLSSVPTEHRETDDEVLLAYLACGDLVDARQRGDWKTAATRGVEAVERLVAGAGLVDDTAFLWPYAVEAVIAAGDEAALARVLAPIDNAPARQVGIGFRAHRLRFAGLVAIAHGNADQVEPNLRRAIADFEEWGSPVYRARAQADLAVWLADHGRPDEAEPLRRAASDTFLGLQANRWLADLGWDEQVRQGNRSGVS